MTVCVKVNSLDPFMDAKLNYKIHFLKPFFVFSSRFERILLHSLQKGQINYFHNISTLAEFDADFNSVKKVGGKVTGKS